MFDEEHLRNLRNVASSTCNISCFCYNPVEERVAAVEIEPVAVVAAAVLRAVRIIVPFQQTRS